MSNCNMVSYIYLPFVIMFSEVNEMGQSLKPGYLLLDKKNEKEVNPFDLKPVISNFTEEPKIPIAASRTGI